MDLPWFTWINIDLWVFIPQNMVQWNHCLKTYCNKNFRGWIAGFNPFCQLIEIRTLRWNCSHWFLFPFNGYQYTKRWLLAAISPKKDYVARNFHADDKHGAAPGRFEFLRGHQADVDSFSQTPAGLTEGHLTSEAALGLCWLVLACLACAALFGRPNPKTNFRDLKVFLFPPPPLQPNTTPKWPFKPCHGGISGP